MRKLWLIFAQTVTVLLAVLFVIMTLKPEWLGKDKGNLGSTALPVIAEASSSPSPSPLPANSLSFRGAAQKALPAVVHIYTSQALRQPRHPFMNDPLLRRFFGDLQPREQGERSEKQRNSGLGSGVIVSANGYILTNNHVIDSADQIEVSLNDGRKLKAKVVGTDPESDIAVLKVEADNLPTMAFGRMEDIQVGDAVLAIGNPFGVGQTVTMGIVSALGRSHLGINTFENFIQTDAAINPGNSGGALVDAAGNLIGINTAIYSRSGGSLGIGFAIPVSLARSIMEQIIQNGSVVRGWLGVEVQDITPEIAASFKLPNTEGALIARVVKDGPAEASGIRAGDVLMMVAGRAVGDPQSMLEIIAALKPDERVPVQIRRDNTLLSLSIKVGKRPFIPRQKEEED